MHANLRAMVIVSMLGLTSVIQAAQPDPYDQSGVPLEVDTNDPKLVKIVLIAGGRSHGKGEHEYFAGCALLMNMLKQTPGVFPVVARDGWPKNEKILDGARAVVFSADGGGANPLVRQGRLDAMQRYIDQGVGFVNLHYAVDYPKGAKGGDRILTWLGGYYEGGYSTNPIWKADFKQLPDSPIARGVRPFALVDEWYYNMRFAPDMKGITPILQAAPPDNTRGTAAAKEHPGRQEIVAWAFERPGGGRSFAFTGGHYHKNWGDENYRRLVTNAILWTANVEIPAQGAKADLEENDVNRTLDKK